jgi:hypothetical protein
VVLESFEEMERRWGGGIGDTSALRIWGGETDDRAALSATTATLPSSPFLGTALQGDALPAWPAYSFSTLDKTADAQAAIHDLRARTHAAWGGQLGDRLEYLRNAVLEEGDCRLSPASIRNLTRFLARHDTVTQPEVVVSPFGNIRAQWVRDSQNRLVIEFLPGDMVRFVFFWRSPMGPSETLRVAGFLPAVDVLSSVAALGPCEWVALGP